MNDDKKLPAISTVAYGHSPAPKKHEGHFRHIASMEKVLNDAVKTLSQATSSPISVPVELLHKLITMGYENLEAHKQEASTNKNNGFQESGEKNLFQAAYLKSLQEYPKEIWGTDKEPLRLKMYENIRIYNAENSTMNKWAKEVESSMGVTRRQGRGKKLNP